jgi:hypothetical protein
MGPNALLCGRRLDNLCLFLRTCQQLIGLFKVFIGRAELFD